MAYDYDLLVIGSGPAGEKGAAQAAYFGKRVAIIERAPRPGGAAVHTGTLPSKTLRETALFLAGHRQRELYGVSVAVDTALAVPRLLSRKDRVRESEVERIFWNLDRHAIPLIQGEARVLDGHTVAVRQADGGEQRLTGEYILIATGSVPYDPPELDFADPAIDDSDTILQLDHMPEALVVLGGGVIGCEYACMFAELGVAVTVVESRARLLPFLDEEIGDLLARAMRRLGIDLRMPAAFTSVRHDPGGIVVSLEGGEAIPCQRVLFAAGRSGATAGLGLEEAGVRLGKRGQVAVDNDFRTSVASIYAAGDVIGNPALASTSMEQGRVAVCHAFGFQYKRQVGELLPYGIYTIPEVSCVGLGEAEAKARGIDVVVGHAPYRHNARGQIRGDTEGVLKLVIDGATRQLIGTHLIGDRATELVHIGQAVMALHGTVDTFIEMVFNYPTLAECYKYAAYDALGRM